MKSTDESNVEKVSNLKLSKWGNISENGRVDVQCRIQAGANASMEKNRGSNDG